MKDLTTLKWMKCFDPLRTCNDDIFDGPLGGKVKKNFKQEHLFLSMYMRSPPEEPHIAARLVTFLGDFSSLS